MSVSFLVTYGTLMRTYGNLDAFGLEKSLTFLSRCQFKGELYDLGSFPGAVPGSDVVYGELFRLTSPNVWDVLDDYEGYVPNQEEASLFVRRKVSLQQPADRLAWVYWYNGDPSGHPRVPSGDWAAYTDGKGT